MIHYASILGLLNILTPHKVIEKGGTARRFFEYEYIRRRRKKSDIWFRGVPKIESELDQIPFPARFKNNPNVHPNTFAWLEQIFGPCIAGPFVLSMSEWKTLTLWLEDVLQQEGVSPNKGVGAHLLRIGLDLAEDEDAFARAIQHRDLHREYWESTGMW